MRLLTRFLSITCLNAAPDRIGRDRQDGHLVEVFVDGHEEPPILSIPESHFAIARLALVRIDRPHHDSFEIRWCDVMFRKMSDDFLCPEEVEERHGPTLTRASQTHRDSATPGRA